MKKAVTINEFANNLLSEKLVSGKDDDVYVPIYDDKLDSLRDILLNDEVESQTFFVAGQSGTGKTTALNFLKTKELDDRFYIKYINMRDFLDERDVDIIDFLLTFAFALVKDTTLEQEYYSKLEELQKKHEGELIEVVEKESGQTGNIGFKGEASAGIGWMIKLRARFFADYKIDSSYRQTTRETFKLKKPDLLSLVNELIDKFREKITKGKQVLAIVDDLDKLKEIRQINSVFLENRNYIFDLKCKKVFSIPTYLVTTPEISNYSRHEIPQFVINLKPNPISKRVDKKKQGDRVQRNKEKLQNVIKCRIDKDISLIDNDALDLAIEYSGGIIRQLIHIVYQAAVKVRRLNLIKISREDIEDGIGSIQTTMSRTIISSNKIKLLDRILKRHIPISETSEEFIELLHANNVLAYANGVVWYEVNPVLEETVKIYSEIHESTDA
ncbi:MAG: hypothetical protein ACM3SY_20745 [Candidatus Omnitrophota bacterium]